MKDKCKLLFHTSLKLGLQTTENITDSECIRMCGGEYFTYLVDLDALCHIWFTLRKSNSSQYIISVEFHED
jgi:hypothetical protein